MPDAVHEGPGNQAADPGGIGHHAGMNPADAVLVEVGEGQGLQVAESRRPQVPVHGNLRRHGSPAGKECCAAGQEDRRDVDHDKQRQGIQGPKPDKVIQGVTLEQGQADIQPGADQTADQHHQQGFPVFLHIGKDPRDAEEGQGHRVLFEAFCHLRHSAFTSFSSSVQLSFFVSGSGENPCISMIWRYRPSCLPSSSGVPSWLTLP